MSTSPPRIPAAFAGLVDDAAVFPPGNAPLDDALRAHREHRGAPYADLVGPLVVADAHLPDLLTLSSTEGAGSRTAVIVVVSGGAGALEGTARWATRDSLLELRGLEIALRDSATGEVAHNARRIVTAVDQLVASGDLDDEVPVYVEPPRLYGAPPTPGWLGALDEVAAAGHRLKFRTCGLDADAFPAAHELAACLEAALDREAPFKCTAGLHHALRHRAPDTGFEHHGFLNVLLATRATFDSAPVDEVAALLETTDPDTVVGALREHGDDALDRTRRWFTSVGSCSVIEPLEDLITLGLLDSRLVEPVETKETP